MPRQSIELTAADGGAIPTELFVPASGSGPGIILVPAIFGVAPDVCDTAEFYAGKGYTVAAPDMFWRTVPGPLGRDEDDRNKAVARYENFDVDQGVRDLGDVMAGLKASDVCTGKAAVMGFCFGGRYAFLAATRLKADAAISFHGTYIGAHTDEAGKVECPMTLHFGGVDPSVPMAEVESIQAALAGKDNVEIVVYPDCAHGFTGKGRPSYNQAADEKGTACALRVLAAM